MEKHIPGLFMAGWAFASFAVLLALSKMLRPDRQALVSKQAFNSGEAASEKPWIRFSIRYQTLLAISVLFLLSALILYPAAVAFRLWLDEGRRMETLGAVSMFLGMLLVALAYAWMSGDLRWIKGIRREEENGDTRERIS